MAPIANIVSELFMLVLSVIAYPSDMNEFRLDVLDHSGQVETVIVRRTDTGFTLLDQQGDNLIEKGTIRPVEGEPSNFRLRLGDAPERTFDFAASIPGFTLEELQKAQSLDLRAGDGEVIHVRRSGSAVYLTPESSRSTYVSH